MNIATPSRTKEIVRKHGFSYKKSLGQNFLIDMNVMRCIIDAAELDESVGALEVGPGIGALTEQLAKRAGCVAAVEIDQRLIPILDEVLTPYLNVQVIHGDILKIDLHDLFQKQFDGVDKVSVVANLPYYITTPILMNLLKARLPLKHIVIMVQKEVAMRMAASPGGKDYGILSVAVQYYAEPTLVCNVSNTVFIPQPNVESAVIRLRVREKPAVSVTDERFLFNVVQASFAHRRKTLWNNLKVHYGNDCGTEALAVAMASAGIDQVRRGETLSLAEFSRLSESIQCAINIAKSACM